MEPFEVSGSVGKHLSDAFPIESGLKQGDASSLLLFNICFRIRQHEGPRREIMISAPGLC